MRKVIRPNTIPNSLAKNGAKWTKELLDAIEEAKKKGIKKAPEKFYIKYKKADVLKALKLMYGDDDFSYCCYCESIIDIVSYEQIEHRMPKRKTQNKYPEKTYDWNNLHLSCSKCNLNKSSQYDENHPILDAAVVDDIEKHLSYEVSPSLGVLRKTLSECGKTTVMHADLDRDALRKARFKVWVKTMDAIKNILSLKGDPSTYTAKKALQALSTGEHGSLVKHLMIECGVWP
jgi:uncharacterized protein (TIGR02646 family)